MSPDSDLVSRCQICGHLYQVNEPQQRIEREIGYRALRDLRYPETEDEA